MSFLLTPARRSAPTLQTLARARTFATSSPRSLARMTIVGRVGTDPEIVETSTGTKVVRYVIGSNSGTKDNPTTSWFRVAAFVHQDQPKKEDYFMGIGKGTLVYLEGDATMKTYEDSAGKKQSSLNLVQTKIDVLKRPNSTGSESGESVTGV